MFIVVSLLQTKTIATEMVRRMCFPNHTHTHPHSNIETGVETDVLPHQICIDTNWKYNRIRTDTVYPCIFNTPYRLGARPKTQEINSLAFPSCTHWHSGRDSHFAYGCRINNAAYTRTRSQAYSHLPRLMRFVYGRNHQPNMCTYICMYSIYGPLFGWPRHYIYLY